MKTIELAEKYEDLAKMISKLNTDPKEGIEYILRKGTEYVSEEEVKAMNLSLVNTRVINETRDLVTGTILVALNEVDKEIRLLFVSNKEKNTHTLELMGNIMDTLKSYDVTINAIKSMDNSDLLRNTYREKLLSNSEMLIDREGKLTSMDVLGNMLVNLSNPDVVLNVINRITDIVSVSTNVLNKLHIHDDKEYLSKIDGRNRENIISIKYVGNDIDMKKDPLIKTVTTLLHIIDITNNMTYKQFTGFDLDKLQGMFDLEKDRESNEFIIKQILTIGTALDGLNVYLNLIYSNLDKTLSLCSEVLKKER